MFGVPIFLQTNSTISKRSLIGQMTVVYLLFGVFLHVRVRVRVCFMLFLSSLVAVLIKLRAMFFSSCFSGRCKKSLCFSVRMTS